MSALRLCSCTTFANGLKKMDPYEKHAYRVCCRRQAAAWHYVKYRGARLRPCPALAASSCCAYDRGPRGRRCLACRTSWWCRPRPVPPKPEAATRPPPWLTGSHPAGCHPRRRRSWSRVGANRARRWTPTQQPSFPPFAYCHEAISTALDEERK
jgi:hypothetical protein